MLIQQVLPDLTFGKQYPTSRFLLLPMTISLQRLQCIFTVSSGSLKLFPFPKIYFVLGDWRAGKGRRVRQFFMQCFGGGGGFVCLFFEQIAKVGIF